MTRRVSVTHSHSHTVHTFPRSHVHGVDVPDLRWSLLQSLVCVRPGEETQDSVFSASPCVEEIYELLPVDRSPLVTPSLSRVLGTWSPLSRSFEEEEEKVVVVMWRRGDEDESSSGYSEKPGIVRLEPRGTRT